MIALLSPCTRNSYKRFEGAHEEDCRAMAGIAEVRAPLTRGSATRTTDRASSRRARTPAPKGHNPSAQSFTGASEVRFPYSSHGIATHTAESLHLDVLDPDP